MKKSIRCGFLKLLLSALASLVLSSTAFGAATIVIQNNDAADTGFNDPAPVSPVGNNTGTTLGQQRLNAFQFAANIWGATLNSNVPITIRASWAALSCTSTRATLGFAGAVSIFGNFPNAPVTGTWYSAALANALAGSDLDPANPEISASFNVNLGNPGCLDGVHFYLGLDNNHGSDVDLVTVLVHEFTHGLGFQTFTNSSTGVQISGFPSIYDTFLFDNTAGKNWVAMTDAERVASAINTGNLVWNGPQVTNDVPAVLARGADGQGRALMFAPNPVQGGSSVSHWDTTEFPNQLMEPNISGDLSHSVAIPLDLTISHLRDVGWSANPIGDVAFFVRQHYLDFLNRQPDASGLAFWTNEIYSCGIDQPCNEVKHINVSAAFFLSIEFQQTGYLVERIYKVAYGDATGMSTFGGPHQLQVPVVRRSEFLPDTQRIGQGVIVGQSGWEQVLENNKQAFTSEFVQRARFTTAYPVTMPATQFVDTLNLNAGNPLSATERNQLISDLQSGAKTRAQVLRAVAEDIDLYNAESNRAFVLMQYFGYLGRNPNDSPDADHTGYDFWLTKLNQFGGNFINAEMVKAFIVSGEYRQRFGP